MMAEQMLQLTTDGHNLSASGGPPSLLLSPASITGIVVGSVLFFLGLVALGVLVVVVIACRVRVASRSGTTGQFTMPSESVILTRILDVNDVSEPQCYSVSEASTDTLQPTVSNYETVTEHRETHGNSTSEYEGVVSHALAIQQPVALNHPHYALMATEVAEGLVYSIVPPQRSRDARERIQGITLQPENIYQAIDSTPLYANVPFLPPARHLADLFDQLAEHSCLEIPRPALNVKETIGSGEFGNVYRGLWETPYGPEEVALKILKAGTGEEDKVKFLQEAAIMAQFRHPHIVRLLGAVTVDEPIILIMDLLHCGDLLAWLSECRKGIEFSLSTSSLAHQLLQFCREIADGMKYLSKKGFVHRDLAARNILLDKSLRCKIADFGLTRDLTFDPYYLSAGKKIPIRWTAPEVIQLLKSKQGFLQPPPPGCPRAVYELMVQCWNPEHHSRPSFSEVLDTLSGAPDSLLAVPQGCLTLIADSSRAARLGAPIMTARDLYKDLQQLYSSSK